MNAQATATVQTTNDASWAVEHFRRFWSKPEPARPTPHLSPEIVGRWPDGAVLEGIEQYRGRLMRIGALIPNIRLEVLEHAVNGDVAFIRWLARGTGRRGPFEMFGVDRIKVSGDQVVENIIHFDTAHFEQLVGAPLSST